MKFIERLYALIDGKKISSPNMSKKGAYIFLDLEKKLLLTNTGDEVPNIFVNQIFNDFDRWEIYEEEVKEPDSPPKENEEPVIGMGLTGYKNDGVKIDYSDTVKDLQQKNNDLQKQFDELRIDVINLRIDVMRLAELITQIRE